MAQWYLPAGSLLPYLIGLGFINWWPMNPGNPWMRAVLDFQGSVFPVSIPLLTA
jgi:hypothetical protein